MHKIIRCVRIHHENSTHTPNGGVQFGVCVNVNGGCTTPNRRCK